MQGERKLTLADAAGIVSEHHGGFCLAILEHLVGESQIAAPRPSPVEVTDALLAHFAKNAYLIHLGYVGLVAKSTLGSLDRVQAFVQRLHQLNAQEAAKRVQAIQGTVQDAKTKRVQSIIPSARMEFSAEEAVRLSSYCISTGIIGFKDNPILADMAPPLHALIELEDELEEDQHIVFRLAVLSMFVTFNHGLKKAETQQWAAVIAMHWGTWFRAWGWVLTEYTTRFWGVGLDGDIPGT